MILGLRVENGVKYKDRTFKFEKGLTTIVGENGAGKSLIQEFIRFGLFGSSALRGKLSDYDPNLRITLSIRIRDENILIKRTLKDCVITASEGEEVRGTSTCNDWIIRRLGYNMSVFDIGNAAKQFEINKLGDMKPAERKNAIDQVIGLNVVTKLVKELKDEKNELKNFVKGFETALVEPVEPKKPENYVDSKELIKVYDEKLTAKDTGKLLKSKCEELKCDQVDEWKDNVPVGDLKNEALYNYYKNEFDKLVKEYPVWGSKYSRDELTKWYFASKEWRAWKEPEISLEEIRKQKSQWVDYLTWKNATRAKCPNCGTEFALGDVKEVDEPQFPQNYLNEMEVLWLKKPSVEKPEVLIDEQFLEAETKKIEAQEKGYEYSKKMAELGDCDYKLLRKYTEHQEKYKKWKEYYSYRTKLRALGDITEIENECKILWDKITEAKLYESKITEYKKQKQNYDTLIESIGEKKDRIEKLEKAISGLTEFTSSVKNSIIPSLSSVATSLCREMSNYDISEIKINDDFEITVDGKELCLLSGSEKAIANLAIRLALSSVLTRKIFNVFMGDEIDESMSEERANSTAECLRRLSSQIEQIILISHRHIVGDNIIKI